VLDALYTLGFYYPPRAKFFRKELGEYLILTRDNHLDVNSIKGSYAGALGIPQFMPSSYRHFGVSYHKGGRVDLFRQNDAIASVANYFHKNGWAPNQPIVERMRSKHQSIADKKAMLITLPVKEGTQYWAAHKNFKVIMTYNHNIVYAMAVYQLSQAIEAAAKA
jgi:membrane-bound lytic murein transglycosylase B